MSLAPRWIALLLVVLGLLSASLTRVSNAQPIQINVGQSSITLNMNLALKENLTSLPSINASLTESNSSSVLQPVIQPINSTIDQRVPGSRVTNFQLHVQTLNSSGTWSLVENYSLTITGANTNLGSNIEANLSFISMNVSQSLTIANLELNGVGSAYLLAFLNAQDPTVTSYFIDGHQTLSAIIPAQTTRTFWLLDLTSVPPVSSWPESQDVLKQTTRWFLDTGSPLYNLTLGRKSPEGPLIKVYVATYYPTFEITVPANAWVNGNTVSFDVSNTSEFAMPAIGALSLIVLATSFLLDRRLSGSRKRKKKS